MTITTTTVNRAESSIGVCDGSIAELAMLLTKADEQDRTAAHQIEDAADSAATKAENDHVAEMRAKADADEAAGLATGLADIVGGAISAAGGACTSTQVQQAAGGLSKMTTGLGGLVAAEDHVAADQDNAAATAADAHAQSDIRMYNRAHDDENAASSSIQKVEQFLDQVQQTKNASLLAAVTFRA